MSQVVVDWDIVVYNGWQLLMWHFYSYRDKFRNWIGEWGESVYT